MIKNVSGSHGGKRNGAGPPQKFSIPFKIEAGQDCEVQWREAVRLHVINEKFKLIKQDSELNQLFCDINSIPIEDRSNWLSSEAYDVHKFDFALELESLSDLHGKLNNASRVFNLNTKPPRGTRKEILQLTAKKFKISEKQIDNIWQWYRRFEKSNRGLNET